MLIHHKNIKNNFTNNNRADKLNEKLYVFILLNLLFNVIPYIYILSSLEYDI